MTYVDSRGPFEETIGKAFDAAYRQIALQGGPFYGYWKVGPEVCFAHDAPGEEWELLMPDRLSLWETRQTAVAKFLPLLLKAPCLPTED